MLGTEIITQYPVVSDKATLNGIPASSLFRIHQTTVNKLIRSAVPSVMGIPDASWRRSNQKYNDLREGLWIDYCREICGWGDYLISRCGWNLERLIPDRSVMVIAAGSVVFLVVSQVNQ